MTARTTDGVSKWAELVRRGRAEGAPAPATPDADLAAAGFVPGPPPWLRAEVLQIDAAVCAEGACERCGASPLLYRPWHRPEGRGTYRAFAVCPRCHCAEEF